MTFTFPKDSANKAGAVRVTSDGNNFFVPTVLFNSNGTTPIDRTNKLSVENYGFKDILYTTRDPLDPQQTVISPTIDMENYRYFIPSIYMDVPTTSFDIQYSEDGINFESYIEGITYSAANQVFARTVYPYVVFLPFARFILKNYTEDITAGMFRFSVTGFSM